MLFVFGAASFMCSLNESILGTRRPNPRQPAPRATPAPDARAPGPRAAPVYLVVQRRFDVGLQGVNSLSNAWNLWGAPGALLALVVMDRSGMRFSLLSGFATQLASALLACAACHPSMSADTRTAFRVLYASQARPRPRRLRAAARQAQDAASPRAAGFSLAFSQAIGALGSPLVLNNVTRLSGDWFPAHERDAVRRPLPACGARRLGSARTGPRGGPQHSRSRLLV